MRVVVVEVRRVLVRVFQLLVGVQVRVFALDGVVVHVVVVAVVVPVRVFVQERRVHVRVGVPLRDVQIHPQAEETGSAERERAERTVAQGPAQGRPNERGQCEDGPRARRADVSLCPQI